MNSALRDAVPDGVSLKHKFQRLLVQAEMNASTSRGVCTFGLRTIGAHELIGAIDTCLGRWKWYAAKSCW
jgi:hypothetical protein